MLNVVTLNVVMLIVVMLNVVMLNVVMLNVIMLNVVMLNVVMLIVVAPNATQMLDENRSELVTNALAYSCREENTAVKTLLCLPTVKKKSFV